MLHFSRDRKCRSSEKADAIHSQLESMSRTNPLAGIHIPFPFSLPVDWQRVLSRDGGDFNLLWARDDLQVVDISGMQYSAIHFSPSASLTFYKGPSF